MTQDTTAVTQWQTLEAMQILLTVGVPVLLWGDPGTGKTATIERYATEMGWAMEQVIASLHDPADFGGLPMRNGNAVIYAPPEWARRITERDGVSLVFLDEVNTATSATQNALMRMVQQHRVGYLDLGARTRFIAAANPVEQNSGAWDLSAPLANRFAHLDWPLRLTEWRCGYLGGWPTLTPLDIDLAAVTQDMIARHRQQQTEFLTRRPQLLCDVPDTASSPRGWPSPRSWERLAHCAAVAETAAASDTARALLAAALVGDAAAAEFAAWLKNPRPARPRAPAGRPRQVHRTRTRRPAARRGQRRRCDSHRRPPTLAGRVQSLHRRGRQRRGRHRGHRRHAPRRAQTPQSQAARRIRGLQRDPHRSRPAHPHRRSRWCRRGQRPMMSAPKDTNRPGGDPNNDGRSPDPPPAGRTDSAATAAAATAADCAEGPVTAAAAAVVGGVPQHHSTGRGRFSAAVRAKLQAARLWVATQRPYYCAPLFACPLIAMESRPTMSIAMDHQWRIYINPRYVTSHTIEQVAAALIHEINHALRSHAERGRRTAAPALDGFWRIACEFEINDDLEDDGLDIGDGLLPEYFGLERQDTAELYYQHLIERSVCVGVVPDCGPICSTHPHHPHALEDCGTEGLTAAQQQLARQATATAVLQYGLDGGDVPLGLREWSQHTARPVVDWRQVLARLLRSSLHSRAGAADYTWQRPCRRQDPADSVIRPAMAAPETAITVVLDTSASMGEADHAKAFAEINAILTRAVPAQAIRVLTVDQQVNTDQHITHARQITPRGRRGTDMAQGIRTAAQTRPAVIIVITDGYTPWPPTRPPGARTTIAALTGRHTIDTVPGWIHAIDISHSSHESS